MQKKYKFDAGHVIFRQGDKGTDLYLIRKGIVDIIKTFDNGEKLQLTTLYEGDILGEMAIAGNQERLADAVCRTECLVAISEADNLDALIESNPVFTKKLIKNFANRLHSSEQKMSEKIMSIDEVTKKRELLLISIIKKLMISSDFINKEGMIKSDFEKKKIELGLNEDEYRRLISISGKE
jgi:CRP-like cAMP-binding protein